MKSNIIGLTDCLRELDKLANATSVSSPEVRKAVEHLGNKGFAEWQTALDLKTPMFDDELDDTKLTTGWNGDTFYISATGENVFFTEFGTGVRPNHGTAYGSSLGFTPRSWSLGPGAGWLAEGDFWYLPKEVANKVYHSRRNESWWNHRVWYTKKYGMREKWYKRKKPHYKAYGHAPVNGTYKALKVMRSSEVMKAFAAEVFKS